MSRIGKKPIKIPEGVEVTLKDSQVTVTGPKGSFSFSLRKEIRVKLIEGNILVEGKDRSRLARALHGTTRAILANMVKGVTAGFERQLVLHGVGFRARAEGENLVLSVGFSHPVMVKAPPGITFSVTEGKIIIRGLDKKQVGEMADKIRRIRPPEPYKGKGIRYAEETVRKKAGKKAAAQI